MLVTTISLTALGINYVLLMPLTGRWASVRDQLASKGRDLKEAEAIIQRAPQWHKEYDELRGKAAQQTGFQMVSDVGNKIEELRSNSGVLIKSTRNMSVVEKDMYRELPVQCSFDATQEGLVKFLFAIQTSPQFMSIEELQVTPQSGNTQLLRCNMRILALMGKSGGAKS